ncbi:MAG: D-alanyl-D-alanine carboxypeptidase [Sedimentibacter sp.]|nr:D-alanyl-D-alanine carboxypeptidase [Sedimentibacter sp.]
MNKLLYNTSSSQILVDGAYISPYYEYATGAKTGYTPEAGNCLVATASKNGTDLIAVAMKGVSLEMYQDAHNLFNYGFEEYQSTVLVNKNTFVQNVKIQNGDSKELSVITESDFTTLLKKSASEEVKSNVIIDELTLPLEANDVIGKIEYSMNGEIIGSVNLITPIAVKSTLTESSGGGIFFSILKFLGTLVVFSLVALILLKVYNDIRIRINRRKRRKKYNNG